MRNLSYSHVTPISKNVCFNKLNDTVSNYNDTIHKKLKQKTGLFIGYASSVNKNKPAPKTDDHVRILKHKIIFAKTLAGEKLKILFQEQIILNT